MAAGFDNFTNVLPNPSNSIDYSGSAEGGAGDASGPGYASVQVTAKFETARDRTNTGVLISRAKASQMFNVNIRYNPLTEEEFMPIYSFLLEKQGMLKSFFVPLPQYDDPQDSTLAGQSPAIDFSVANANDYTAGATKITIDAPGYDNSTDGTLRPGDLITFTDSLDSNHLKAYKITRVETTADYQGSTPPGSAELRISISPPLRKDLRDNATVNYKNPKIKVVMKSDTVQYDLKTDNRYAFSLNLEEVQ